MPRRINTIFRGPFATNTIPEDNEDWMWNCSLCNKLNEYKDEVCLVCGRPAFPEWLYVNSGIVKVQVGVRLELPLHGESYGIIVSIDILKRKVGVLVAEYFHEETRIGEVVWFEQHEFNEFRILSTENKFHEWLDSHGYCDRCGKTYLICNWENLGRDGPQIVDGGLERLQLMKESMQEEMTKKMEFIEDERYNEVLKCTERIKFYQSEIKNVKKSMEPIQDQCPFCTIE